MKTKLLLKALPLLAVVAALPSLALTYTGTRIDSETIGYENGDGHNGYMKFRVVNDSEADLIYVALTPNVEHVWDDNFWGEGEGGIRHVYYLYPSLEIPDTLVVDGRKYAVRNGTSGSFVRESTNYEDGSATAAWVDAVNDGCAGLSAVYLPFKTLESGLFAATIQDIETLYLPNVEVIEDNMYKGGSWEWEPGLAAQLVCLGPNVREIGAHAFSGSAIVMDSNQPFQLADDAFGSNDLGDRCDLYVRNCAVERFRQQWPQYSDRIQGLLDVEATETTVTISPKKVKLIAGSLCDNCDFGMEFVEVTSDELVTIDWRDARHEGLMPGTTYRFPVRVYRQLTWDGPGLEYTDTVTVRMPGAAAVVILAAESWVLASTAITATFTLGCEADVERAWVTVDGRDVAATATTADGTTRIAATADGLQPGTIYELTAHCVVDGQEYTTTVTLPTLCDQQTRSGDVTGDGVTDIDDVNRVINIMLKKI